MVLGLGESMCFLPVEQFAVKDGASDESFAGSWDWERANADRYRPEPLSDGLKHGVFLPMSEMPDT